jgi:gas vesicle structural protein
VSLPDTTHPFTPELAELGEERCASICEVLDRVLNKGAVVVGEITISVANVDLLYLGLQLVLTSVQTARETMNGAPGGSGLKLEIGKKRI